MHRIRLWIRPFQYRLYRHHGRRFFGYNKGELYIIALNTSSGNENGNQYGDTEGTVTLTYENENGEEFSQETTFHTTVNRPIVQLPQTDTAQEEEKATAWWTVVLAMGLGILLALGGMALGNRKKNRTSP